MPVHVIRPDHSLRLQDIPGLLDRGSSLALSDESRETVRRARDYVDGVAASGDRPIYGINTGFGALCNTAISRDELATLQINLLRSHAAGTGPEVPERVVRLMLLFKVHALARGFSGISETTLDLLCGFFNSGISPVVYEQGSLGASGDLAPLAHLVLPLVGEGSVRLNGDRMPAREALERCRLEPVTLASKEGLALINGTQFMSACLAEAWMAAAGIAEWADRISALSLDAFHGQAEPFDPRIHGLRPFAGQREVAHNVLRWLEGSPIASRALNDVQDPYSFRCIPQVHGASRDVFAHVAGILETEVNSVTDNPLVFAGEDAVLSGGNFHGQPLAMAADYMALALAELGSISERRTYKLLSGQRGLPPFLAADPGLHSGYMIAQYTAASIVSLNRQLCTPTSVDTIDSSNGQEDHVSMGANGTVRCLRLAENVRTLLTIELLLACQALDFRRPGRTSPALESLHAEVRECIPFMSRDAVLHDQIRMLHHHIWR